MPSGISTLLRQIHPRDKPETRTCTQSVLKSSISNSSCMLARNCGFAVRLGVETTGVPDFLTATRFLGCAVFLRISCRLSASACKALSDFSFGASAGCALARSANPWLTDDEKVRSVSGNLGAGAEIDGSAVVG